MTCHPRMSMQARSFISARLRDGRGHTLCGTKRHISSPNPAWVAYQMVQSRHDLDTSGIQHIAFDGCVVARATILVHYQIPKSTDGRQPCHECTKAQELCLALNTVRATNGSRLVTGTVPLPTSSEVWPTFIHSLGTYCRS